MARRQNRVRLSDDELEQVKQTRERVYGDERVPMGVVIDQACKEMANNRKNASNVKL